YMVDSFTSPGSAVDDSQIQSELYRLIFQSPNLARPDANTIYVVFTPKGTEVTSGTESSEQYFLGYHNYFGVTNSAPVNYIVMPYPASGNLIAGTNFSASFYHYPDVFNSMTAVFSHELAETVTDPEHTAWYDDRERRGSEDEVGDKGVGDSDRDQNGNPAPDSDDDGPFSGDPIPSLHFGWFGNYVIQKEWSNRAGKCILPTASGFESTGYVANIQYTKPFAAGNQHFTETEGTPFSETLAYYQPADPNVSGADFSSVTIDWGDKTTSQASLSGVGNVRVSGSHVYAKADVYTVTIRASTVDGDYIPETTVPLLFAGDSIFVNDAPLTPSPARLWTMRPGVSATREVGRFTDASATASAADFKAPTINWGDNTSSTGTIVPDPAGGFDVMGTHAYAGAPGAAFFPSALVQEHFQGSSTTVTGAIRLTPSTLIGDYDGTGRTEQGVYRPSTGLWIIASPGGARYTY
ncbi:MAG: hypothetical protein LC745_12380, partial [Planctomycetia bacterium]|nr:hypothetical protein [Planctomycetia bacterium]